MPDFTHAPHFRETTTVRAHQAQENGVLEVLAEPEYGGLDDDIEPEPEVVARIPYRAGDYIINDAEVMAREDFEERYSPLVGQSGCYVLNEGRALARAVLDADGETVHLEGYGTIPVFDFQGRFVRAAADGTPLCALIGSPEQQARALTALSRIMPQYAEDVRRHHDDLRQAHRIALTKATRDGEPAPKTLLAQGHLLEAAIASPRDVIDDNAARALQQMARQPMAVDAGEATPITSQTIPTLLARRIAGNDEVRRMSDQTAFRPIAALPSYMQESIRAIGRQTFQRFAPNQPLEHILAVIGPKERPEPPAQLTQQQRGMLMRAFDQLRHLFGDREEEQEQQMEDSRSVLDRTVDVFSGGQLLARGTVRIPQMPNYEATIELRERDGITMLYVEDFYARYGYFWPSEPAPALDHDRRPALPGPEM